MVNGKLIVYFTSEENDLLASTCRLTLIGKFARTQPSIKRIITEFAKLISTNGIVRIGAYNLHHIFIDFDLDEDHRIVYGRNSLNIYDIHMKLLKWSADFNPKEETTRAPVWVNLPEFP
ncbi:hypothetical protein P3L10_030150 [Capsicum annuum]